MHRPKFGASSPRGRRRVLDCSAARLSLLAPLARRSAPRARGLFACLRRGAERSRRADGGDGCGFQQRTAQETICRGFQASRAQARVQPRLPRRASRAAQRALARQLAIERGLSRAPAHGARRSMALAPSITGGWSSSRTASAPSASGHPGARSASIIATPRAWCAGSCATSATPRSGCWATMPAACWRPWPISTASASFPQHLPRACRSCSPACSTRRRRPCPIRLLPQVGLVIM